MALCGIPKTFKEQVEEIENTSELKISHELSKSGWCKENKNCVKYRNCTNCIKQWKADRILAAHNAELDRIAEGMIEMANNPYDGETKYYTDIEESPTDIAGSAFSEGQVAQLEKCQAYIQAQKGS